MNSYSFAVHTHTVPRATTVVVCWLLPTEQNQLVSQQRHRHVHWEFYHIRKCMWYQWWSITRANLIRRFGFWEPGNKATNCIRRVEKDKCPVLHTHSLRQNVLALYSLSSSCCFSRFSFGRLLHAILYYSGQSEDRWFTCLATCRSGTSVVHKSTREWLIWLIEAGKWPKAYFSNVTFMHF